jgi:hypothetical protein
VVESLPFQLILFMRGKRMQRLKGDSPSVISEGFGYSPYFERSRT